MGLACGEWTNVEPKGAIVPQRAPRICTKTFFLHPFEPSDCHELRSNRHHACCWVREGRQYGNKDVLNSVTSPRSTSSSSVFAPRLAKRLSKETPEPSEKSSRWSAFMHIFFAELEVPQVPSSAEPPPAEVLPEPTATDGPVPVSAVSKRGRCTGTAVAT